MDRATIRLTAAAIALAMLMASIPATGVMIAEDRSGQPCFTVDICHPLQSLCASPGAIAIARPAPPVALTSHNSSDGIADPPVVEIAKFVMTPDPPPPKRAA
ncbi:MAG TPA: hypothetical protein VMU16_00210 [Candidatus Binataceae bacterium]|nr:hypothetical protein [Candidatus Binataceae bacterium]